MGNYVDGSTMISILFTMMVFLVTFYFQVIILRVFRKFHIHPFVSFILYGIGLLITVLLALFFKELPLTSILIYILLTTLLITFSFVPLLDLQSPSSIIMTMLEKKQQSFSKLQNAFDDRQFILIRLEDLVAMGLVQKREQKYSISPMGMISARIISIFSLLVGIKI